MTVRRSHQGGLRRRADGPATVSKAIIRLRVTERRRVRRIEETGKAVVREYARRFLSADRLLLGPIPHEVSAFATALGVRL